jgi:hypothetical protein
LCAGCRGVCAICSPMNHPHVSGDGTEGTEDGKDQRSLVPVPPRVDKVRTWWPVIVVGMDAPLQAQRLLTKEPIALSITLASCTSSYGNDGVEWPRLRRKPGLTHPTEELERHERGLPP